MKIAIWNVNSINQRLPHLLQWVEAQQPDVVMLQELKCMDEKFPRAEIETAGFQAEVFGQKSWNGVAILSRHPMTDVMRGLPGDADDLQSRYIEATVQGIRVCGIYLPNGNPVDSEKYPYKLKWMDRLADRALSLLATRQPVVMGGDYNVIPEERDCHDPAAWAGDALFLPESRQKFRTLLNLGLTDAFRAFNDEDGAYTFWDYQAGAWPRNHGIRIDHFLLSPQALDRAESCVIDKTPRGWDKASDHVPVMLTLRG